MSKRKHRKSAKLIASLILAVVVTFVGIVPAKVYASSAVFFLWVPAIPTYSEPGIPGNYLPSDVFTVSEGATVMAVAAKATTNTGDPTCIHAVIQQWTGVGWKYLVGQWFLVDKEGDNIGGALKVKPGEKYRVICSCTQGNLVESSVDIVIAFSTN